MQSALHPTVDAVAVEPTPCPIERPMGNTELSYYLPARADGVNDMCVPIFPMQQDCSPAWAECRYLHIGFNAPDRLMERARVRLVWGILRVRHPLLACTVTMHSYEDVRFVCV